MNYLRVAEGAVLVGMVVGGGVLVNDLHHMMGQLATVNAEALKTVQNTNTVLQSLNTTVVSVNKLVSDLNTRTTYTSQLLNANLLHLDLTLGEVQRASLRQKEVTDAALATIRSTDGLLKESTVTVAALQPVLKDADETVRSVHRAVASEDVVQTLHSINESVAKLPPIMDDVKKGSDQTVQILSHTNDAVFQVDKGLERALKPGPLWKSILSEVLNLGASARRLFGL